MDQQTTSDTHNIQPGLAEEITRTRRKPRLPLPQSVKKVILAGMEAIGHRVIRIAPRDDAHAIGAITPSKRWAVAPRRLTPIGPNDLAAYADIFEVLQPWAGNVPRGYFVDFLGTLTDGKFQEILGVDREKIGGGHVTTRFPPIGNGDNGEGWFEAVNWIVAAQEARKRFVMITLGACYGAQIVGGYRALQLLNPMPCKLVAVEPVPQNYAWMIEHLRNNGTDPDDHWLILAAISERNDPVFFPVGAAGSGAQNCYSTNHEGARIQYLEHFIASGETEAALRNLLLHNATGIEKRLSPVLSYAAEIRLVSAITLRDLLGPFDFVDYIESDIQQSEILIFAPFMDLLKRKVRRIHIGTHGKDVHRTLHELFERDGWEIVFSFEPESRYESALGPFVTNDGVLTVRNPGL